MYTNWKRQSELAKEKEMRIKSGNMTEASMLQKELNEAEEKLEQIKKRFHKRNECKTSGSDRRRHCRGRITVDKIPVSRLAESESAEVK